MNLFCRVVCEGLKEIVQVALSVAVVSLVVYITCRWPLAIFIFSLLLIIGIWVVFKIEQLQKHRAKYHNK